MTNLKAYNVYKHDCGGVKSVNHEQGYHVTLATTEGFRDIPITSLIWSATVNARDKSHAISVAKSSRPSRAF